MVDPTILILFAVLIAFMFFTSRKARRQQNEKMAFQAELAPGQQVVTASGLVGTVVEVEGDLVTLEHAPGSVTTWVRAAVARPYEPVEEYEDDEEGVDDDAAVETDAPADGDSTTPGLIDKP